MSEARLFYRKYEAAAKLKFYEIPTHKVGIFFICRNAFKAFQRIQKEYWTFSIFGYIIEPMKEKASQKCRKEMPYTKHHLKFGKNQADNLEYIGFRRRFFPVFYWCLVL